MTYSKVKEAPGLVRDEGNKAILCVDKDAYQKHNARRNAQRALLNASSEVQEVKKDMASLKKDMDELKMMLKTLINTAGAN